MAQLDNPQMQAATSHIDTSPCSSRDTAHQSVSLPMAWKSNEGDLKPWNPTPVWNTKRLLAPAQLQPSRPFGE